MDNFNYLANLKKIVGLNEFKDIRDIFTGNESLHTGSKKYVILYHSDLDGNTSGYEIMMLFRNCRAFDAMSEVSAFRINYNYDLKSDKNYDMMSALKVADCVFIVDYSIRDNHINDIMDTIKNDCRIVWIDHHATSLNVVNKKTAASKRFMEYKYIYPLVYSEKGISGCFLCHALYYYASNSNHCISLSHEKFITYVSMYDTFYKDADRKFYYAASRIGLDLQNRFEKGYPDNLFVRINEFRYGTDYIMEPYLNIIGTDSRKLGELVKEGGTIMEYDIASHHIQQKSGLFETTIKFNGEEYSCAVMNARGNSFVFEEEYDTHDCVCLFYFNNYGTYTYSIYANEYADHCPPCNLICSTYGGGGHNGAAGFTSNINIFEWMNNKYHTMSCWDTSDIELKSAITTD